MRWATKKIAKRNARLNIFSFHRNKTDDRRIERDVAEHLQLGEVFCQKATQGTWAVVLGVARQILADSKKFRLLNMIQAGVGDTVVA